MKKRVSIVVGVAVSGALLYLALRSVHPSEVLAALSRVHPAWLLPMVGFTALDLLVRAVRWRLLLSQALGERGPASVAALFRLEAIGLAVNNVVFLRLGELARAFLAGKELGLPTLTVLATIFVERALDTIALLTLFGAAGLLLPEAVAPALARLAFVGVAGLLGALAAIAWVDGFLKENASWETRLRSWPTAHRLIEQTAMGTLALRSWSLSAKVGALSFGLWLADAGVYWVGARAMGLEPSVGYGRAIVVLAAAAGSCIIPAAPGSFGAFEQAVKLLLERWGVDGSAALAYAGFVHVVMYGVMTGLGFVFLSRAGLSVARLRSALEGQAR